MSDTETGCIIPLVQSAAIGIMSALFTLALAMWQSWPSPGWLALGAGSVTALLSFASGITAWRKSAYPDNTPVYTTPIDPGPNRVKVELSETQGAARKTQLAELEATPAQLRKLADGLLSGVSFSQGFWCGAGKPFSRAQFDGLRYEFMRRGWCNWKNESAPAQGVTLTAQGRAVLRSFASETDAPRYKGFMKNE